jgi:arylsulfatase A-like enzyme
MSKADHTRREWLGMAAAAAAASGFGQPAKRPPNILFILADDLGYGDLGCYGQKKIATPNIDRIAQDGVRFTQAYAGSTVCAPSRCALMSGKHTGHGAVRGNRFPEIPVPMSDPTIAEVLKRAGYRTAIFGKWGLGGPESTSTPTERGFDEFFGFLSHLHAHQAYPDHLWEGRVETMLPKNWFYQKKQYAPDLFTDRALQFIDRTSDKPFFTYLSYTVPHADNELGELTGVGIEVPDQGIYANEEWPEVEKNFAASITRMDTGIGRILELLKRKGLERDTLVIFTSDNGPHKEGGHSPEFFASRGGLRGVKRDLYEGGIRVPAVARWPGRVKPGTVSEVAWAFWDVLPTLAEAGGAAVPRGIDGESFLRTLEGRVQPPHTPFYWEFHEGGFQQAVRVGDSKLVRQLPHMKPELYDLFADPGETHDLADVQPALVERLTKVMRTSRVESRWWPTNWVS